VQVLLLITIKAAASRLFPRRGKKEELKQKVNKTMINCSLAVQQREQEDEEYDCVTLH